MMRLKPLLLARQSPWRDYFGFSVVRAADHRESVLRAPNRMSLGPDKTSDLGQNVGQTARTLLITRG
jgi:hypothetical protein